jgi:hypothetical protein
MSETDSLRQIAQSRAPWSVWWGIVFLFALFGVIVLALIGPSPRGDHYEQFRAKKRLEILQATREDAKSLNTYAWIDKNKGKVRIPIERAMQLAATELAQKKPAAAGPIALPSPAAQTSPAPSAATATPAAANNRPKAQPGATAMPQASPAVPSEQPALSPAGTPIPVPGKTP